jgi:N utilization substance protein B
VSTFDLATELVSAANAGRDLSRIVRDGVTSHRDLERYRDAVAMIEAANRDPSDAREALLVDDAHLDLIVRVFRRDEALTVLYEADQRGTSPDVSDVSEQAGALVAAVWSGRSDIDAVLESASTGWRVDRMPPVDRSILRIAVWELLERPDTPVPVVISEAIRLAKAYSTERSGGFINGVLGKVASIAR